MFAVRLRHPAPGFLAGDSILAHPALGPDFALVRLIPARYSLLLQLDNAGVLEHLGGPMHSAEVTRLLEMHFQTLRRRARPLALVP